MEIKDTARVYFVGVGGIGMAALARYYRSLGLPVAGYDRTPSPLTAELVREGVAVSYDDSMDAVPAEFRDAEGTLVVYTPAVPDSNVPLGFFRDGGFEVRKRSWVLGQITRGSRGLCFAGTHGKTTTSSMAAHVLHSGPVGCNAFLGGILRGYNSNLILSPTSPYSVIEADEYDRSFHRLSPHIAVITATDPDHLDIYGTEEAYLESFAHFTELIQPGGFLVVHTGLKLVPRVHESVRVYTFGREEGDFHAANVRCGDGRIVFDFVYPGGTVADIELGVPVAINVDNAVASLAAVWLTGTLTPGLARRAMASYPGVERRFEFHLKEDGPCGRAVIDDYAHHPDELRQSIASVRALYPGRRLTVAFQPHLYSRTRDFAPQFAEALDTADEVVLIDLYPAREEPIPGISSKTIFDKLNCPHKSMISKENFVDTMKNSNFEILLTAGAGDLNLYVPQLVRALRTPDGCN
ncbi:MAG: UDP-N-acetylmuramate--L-alanine ligase [Muribaculaceae bacterium]|nr:UDP-N-acetylmuramate--L-alanine ligase [Muribaculaceae bacterium]